MDDQDRPGWSPPSHDGGSAPSAPLHLSAPELASAGPRRSRIGRGIAVAAIGIGALGIAGTAYASSATPTPSPSADNPSNGYAMPGANGQARPGMPGRGPGSPDGKDNGRMRGPGLGGGFGMGIHGSFVTPKQGGGYQTVNTQVGKVTAVSATSITVTSVDGFTATYVVTADTIVHAKKDGIGSVSSGDEVMVAGVVSGSVTKAVRIVDRTQVGAMRQKWAPPKPTSSAAPSSTSSGTA